MFNYKIIIEYDGTEYFGWQRQKLTNKTIQETIESSLKKLTGEEITITGAGRTDTGVHAFNQAANFKTKSKVVNTGKFLYSLNSILPDTISVKEIDEVPDDFHARYSAKKREYEYYITTSKKALYSDYYSRVKYELDTKKIEDALEIFKGEKSFKSLCKNPTDKHDFKCEVFEIGIKNLTDTEIRINISANRFLHSMVRAITGCLVDIGRGKLTKEEVRRKLKKGEKIRTTYLPAKGLFLKKIYY